MILVVLLALAQGLLAAIGGPRGEAPARWPTGDAAFAVDRWAVGPAMVESAWGIQHAVRDYTGPDGVTVALGLSTSPTAKRLYRTGADLAFLGAGYTAEAAPPGLVPPAAGREAVLLRRGDEGWLLLYAYGERRGLLGNGALGWGMAVLDGILGRTNDYFLLRAMARLDGPAGPAAREAGALADVLFPRLAAWYADCSRCGPDSPD